MTPDKIRANLEQWVQNEAFHTIAGACGDLLREVDRLAKLNKAQEHIIEHDSRQEEKYHAEIAKLRQQLHDSRTLCATLNNQ